jgi:HSP20 family protein
MALVKWTPWAEWETLRNEMDHWFERALPTVFGREEEAAKARWPRVDVRETDAAYVVETDLPGMTAETITVEAEGPYVVVKGERRTEHEEGEGEKKRTERVFGTFYRKVALPETAKFAEAAATYEHGVLTVTVPKGDEAKVKAKAITVNAA